MRFIPESNITAKEVSNENFMPKIDIDKNSTHKLIQNISDLRLDNAALKLLNCLGQNIESINTKEYSYFHLKQKLQFSELSRGEQVFLVSYAAKVSNEQIYLQYDILQLTKSSLRKYYKEFKDCDNINIIYSTLGEYNYLTMAMQGEI